MLKLKFLFDKNILKFSKSLLTLLILRCKTEVFSSLSSPRKFWFWCSSDNTWGVFRFWILVLKMCKSRALELPKRMFPGFSKGPYLKVSNVWAFCSLLIVSLVITSIFKDKNHARKTKQINVCLSYTIVMSHYDDALAVEACTFILPLAFQNLLPECLSKLHGIFWKKDKKRCSCFSVSAHYLKFVVYL